MSEILIEAQNITKRYELKSKTSKKELVALNGVSLYVAKGESVGIAGESGCGKSTLAKILAALIKPDSGSVIYQGKNINELDKESFKSFRRDTQMIFQDPFSSLNPRMRIFEAIEEPLLLSRIAADDRKAAVDNLIKQVGLENGMLRRFPDEFSGGQRQRIVIARALAANPSFLIADEPVSALDISVQAQIINLLLQLKNDYSLTLLLISHNLSVIRHICSRVIVMYLGGIVEVAESEELFTSPKHPYTKLLLSAIPDIKNGKREVVEQNDTAIEFTEKIEAQCSFAPRCRFAEEICFREKPRLLNVSNSHQSACHFWNKI